MWMLAISLLLAMLLAGLLVRKLLASASSGALLEEFEASTARQAAWDWGGLRIEDRDRALQLEFEREARYAQSRFQRGFAAHPGCFRAEGRIWSE